MVNNVVLALLIQSIMIIPKYSSILAGDEKKTVFKTKKREREREREKATSLLLTTRVESRLIE